ncbi:hypothetical protein CPter291_1140 [Collimonas pratensis]|uniref:Uncharacterized protein n=1 Tax=Collimonas pratensis TaxID=279113 RepID=A0ABN4M6M0_9BURK|nr:hypothetical protein CPter291_1140 [Collimonas pratensis]
MVGDIDKNQTALIKAVEKIHASGRELLLDGHFVLKDFEGKLQPIDPEIFSALNLNGIVLLEDSPEIVQKRLGDRDANFLVENIATFSAAEKKQAELVCRALNIRLEVLFAPTEISFTKVMDSFFDELPN